MAVATSSNPISSIAPTSSPISSFPDPSPSYPPSYAPASNLNPNLLTHLKLLLRDRLFRVERETLMTLPESVLLCLFPNGLALSRNGGNGWGGEDEGEGEGNDEGNVFGVDYDPASFTYILSFWQSSHSKFYGPSTPTPTSSSPDTHPSPESLYAYQQKMLPQNVIYPSLERGGPNQNIGFDANQHGGENPLTTKQPIIVLREELEYFAIPFKPGTEGVPSFARSTVTSTTTTNEKPTPNPIDRTAPYAFDSAKTHPTSGEPTPLLLHVKREAGKALLDRKAIFTALQRNVSKEGNVAEQHLIDMLCMSGFSRNDTWGYRSIEPSRCCISSIALVLLKTGITHHPPGTVGGPDSQRSISIDQAQMNTAQKLLLFWRKPARKCWWDGVTIDLPVGGDSKQVAPVKIWARRVWTLELSLI